MRIVHLITRLVHGGAQVNTIMTVEHQRAQGHEVWLAAGPETGPEGSLWARADATLLRHLVRAVRPWHDVLGFFEIVRLLTRVRPHVVHTHTSKAGLLGRWAAWWVGVPIVIHTPHGHVFHSYFSPLTSRLFITLERLSARITRKLIMLTEAERDEHLAAGVADRDKMVVIPSGVDLDVLPVVRPSRTDLGLPPEGPLIGYVGRLAEIKGPGDLVRAMPRVLEKHPRAHLVMGGDGPERAAVEAETARLKIADRVTMLGALADAGGLLSVVDLVVVPSRNEGMGRVAVEAMAAGLPVVATRVGGLAEVIVDGETGLLVSCGDVGAMAQAIVAVLSDPPGARRMGEAGRHRAARYSTAVMLSALDALYSDLL